MYKNDFVTSIISTKPQLWKMIFKITKLGDFAHLWYICYASKRMVCVRETIIIAIFDKDERKIKSS